MLEPLRFVLHLAGFAVELLWYAFEEAPLVTFLALFGLIWLVLGRRKARRPFRKSLLGAAAVLAAAISVILIRDLASGRVSLFR